MKRYNGNPKYKIPNIDRHGATHDETIEDKVVSEIQEILRGPNTITRRWGHSINVQSVWDRHKNVDVNIKIEAGKIEVVKNNRSFDALLKVVESGEDKPQIIEMTQPDCLDKLEAMVNWMLR